MKKYFTFLFYLSCFIPLINAQVTFDAISNFAFNDSEAYIRGISWVDVDNDFDLDVCLSGGVGVSPDYESKTAIYLNDGMGNFTQSDLLSTNQIGTMSHGWADYDNDGDLDVYIAATWNFGGVNELWVNNGAAGFEKFLYSGATGGSSPYEGTVSWGDYNNDGNMDLFLARWNANDNLLYMSNGSGGFTNESVGELTDEAHWTSGGIWADYDNDGDLDIYVFDYQTGSGGPGVNSLYDNNGDGTFTKNTTAGEVVTDAQSTRTANWVDANNDGFFDLYVVNQGSANKLYLNQGNGTFSTLVTPGSDGTSWGSNWGDFDNDGDEDLFVIGMWGDDSALYTNDGTGVLTNVSSQYSNVLPLETSGSMSNTVMFTDYNNDGWLDIHVVQPNTIADRLYHNNGEECISWFKVKCTGVESNWSAIGTKVRALATINGQEVWQLRQVSAQTSKSGQNPMWPHFGFGDAAIIDSLVVEWPSGAVCSYSDVAVNQFVEIVEDCSINEIIAPTPITGEVGEVTLCLGDDDIQLQIPSGNTTGEWSASCGNCLNEQGFFFASTMPAGEYQAIYAEGGICGFRDTVNISISPLPELSISNDTTVIETNTVELWVDGADSYLWTPSEILSCDDCTTPSFIALEDVSFTVTGTSALGCVDTASVNVYVETIPTFEMPNVFSPNADQINDTYGPVFLGDIFTAFSMKVYSRWGELVFETTNPSIVWDGMYEGDQSPNDVYIYMVDYELTNGENGALQGEVTLIR